MSIMKKKRTWATILILVASLAAIVGKLRIGKKSSTSLDFSEEHEIDHEDI